MFRKDKISRNGICPCGSGKKYKKCCKRDPQGSLLDFSWKQLRRLEGEIMERHLIPYATKIIPIEVTKEAIRELLPEDLPDELDDGLLFTSFFVPWLMYNWLPPSNLNLKGVVAEESIALQYSKQYADRLNRKQKSFIEAMCQTYYSFYVILEVIPEQALIIKDILLAKECEIKERQGTHYLKRGDIVFSRILLFESQSIFIGMAPYVVPANYHHDLIELRHFLMKLNKGKILTGELLRNVFELDLIEEFFSIMKSAFNRALPELRNTDGDPVQLCKSYFKLGITPQGALEKLLPLTLSDNKEEFLSEAKRDKHGLIAHIGIPWLKKGNKQHSSWENTLMGYIKISEEKLILETNSEKRSEEGRLLLNQYLKDAICFQKMLIESMEQKLRDASIEYSSNKKTEINEPPEIQQALEVVVKKHWENWFNEPIPLLNNKTPRQAAKTKKGREQLEALLLLYECHNNESNNLLKADISYLKAQLGLTEEVI